MDIIKDLETEILALKTAIAKSSSQIATKIIRTTYNTGLRLVQSSTGYRANFKQMLYITLTSKNGQPFLATLTIKNQNFNNRTVNNERFSASGNTVSFSVWVYGNSDDVARLQRGEEVNLSYDINLIVSNDCNISTWYEVVG